MWTNITFGILFMCIFRIVDCLKGNKSISNSLFASNSTFNFKNIVSYLCFILPVFESIYFKYNVQWVSIIVGAILLIIALSIKSKPIAENVNLVAIVVTLGARFSLLVVLLDLLMKILPQKIWRSKKERNEVSND